MNKHIFKGLIWGAVITGIIGSCKKSPDYTLYDYTEETEITTEYSDFIYESMNDNGIYENKENGNDIQITYPTFSESGRFGMNADKATSLVKDSAMNSLLVYDCRKDTNLALHYDIFVTDEDIVSVVFSGIYSQKDSAYPLNIRYTVNISTETCKLIKLTDYADAEKILEILKDPEQYKIRSDQEQRKSAIYEYISNCPEETLRELILNADEPHGRAECAYSNFESSSGAFVLSIPVHHALGDHAEILLGKSLLKKVDTKV